MVVCSEPSAGRHPEKVVLLAEDLEADRDDDLDIGVAEDPSNDSARSLATVASLVIRRRKVAGAFGILCVAGAAVIALGAGGHGVSAIKGPSMDHPSVLLGRVATMLDEGSTASRAAQQAPTFSASDPWAPGSAFPPPAATPASQGADKAQPVEHASQAVEETSGKPSSSHHGEEECHDAKEGTPCYFSVHWAMTHGIYEHPEWYDGITPGSSFKEFQMSIYSQKMKTNCTGVRPCGIDKLKKKAEEAAKSDAADSKTPEESSGSGSSKKVPPPGPRTHTFYMYRAQSEASYPLENINTADLAGVFWYLHNEVIVATPRKYKIDRIKRYKVTVKNTWEFWNAHKRQFGAFVAYDAGRCSSPVCKDIYHQYGFIVGCQVQPLSVAGYLGRHQTNWQCKDGQDECRAPIWYSLPGPCPAKGIPNNDIDPNRVGLDVNKYKSAECVERMPGGHCKGGATGAPDCTYSYEEAGEIFLDELVGITEKYSDYNEFWNTSFTHCMRDVTQHKLPKDHLCRHNKEYDPESDEGVGTSFWNGKHDTDKCTDRLDAARKLFKKNFPDFPEHLDEPACEFDMYYDGEFDWKINHTGAEKSDWWENRM